MERAKTHLELAIDLDSDPITGSVSNGTLRSKPFRGWVELVAAIEAARSSVPQIGSSDDAGAKTLGLVPGANATEL